MKIARDLAGERTARSADTAFSALIVDPSVGSSRIKAHGLTRAGYHVAEATTSGEALSRIRGLRPHVLVIDLDLGSGPDVNDGIELCRQLRTRPDIGNPYVLLLLQRAQLDRLFEAFLAGVDDYVIRPCPPWALLGKVARGERVMRAAAGRFR